MSQMENVSHNTSFDSNEDENMSHAASQPEIEQDWSAQKQSDNRYGYSQDHRSQQLNRQNSDAETEQNPYGFATNADNPQMQVQQAIWEDFQRSQMQIVDQSEPTQRPFTRSHIYSPDDLASDQFSRPTAAFGNHNGGSSTIDYPDEVQMEDEESEVVLKNRHLRFDDRGTPQMFLNSGKYEVGDDQHHVLNTEEAIRQQQARMYQEEFARRFQPEQSLTQQELYSNQQILRSHEPNLRVQSANNVLMQQQSTDIHQKKRSRADFLNNAPSASQNQSMQSIHQSQHSSASKQSILESVKNQQSNRLKQKERELNPEGQHQITAGMTELTLQSQPRTNEHSRKQLPGKSQLVTAKTSQNNTSLVDMAKVRAFEDDDIDQISQDDKAASQRSGMIQEQQIRRDSFPHSDEGFQSQYDWNTRAKLIVLLRSRIGGKQQLERAQKRTAFDRLFLNRQGILVEQLLTDNENLLDQIQLLQHQHQEQERNSGFAVVDSIPYDLYNQGVGATQKTGRNNENADQTHSTFEHHGIQQHTNSSNKDLSPQNKGLQKDNAFMRAMLRDDNNNYMSPYSNLPHQNCPQEESSQFIPQAPPQPDFSKLQNDPFFETFAAELRDVTILGQKLQMGQYVEIEGLSSKLDELCGSFELKSDKIRLQCQQVEQNRDLLATKVQGVDRLELENLELHMQLDAKLRALETLLKCSSDASRLFKFDYKKQTESGCQTDLRYTDLSQKEATLEVFSKELSLVKMRQVEDVEVRKRDLEKRECDIEIRERLIEEKRVEYSYKQKELNQRIKSQMTWPLNCLENDTKLLEKFKDFKLKSDHLKNLEADSNLSLFMQREENMELLQGFQGEMQIKCEGLLHFEYLLLKERAKNIVFHENTLAELTNLQAESDELAKDRERYQISSDLERQNQEDSQRVDQASGELINIQDNLMKLVTALGNTLSQLSKSPREQDNMHNITSPETKGSRPYNQLNLLLSNLKKSFSSHAEDLIGQRMSPAINPYSQTISAKDPETLLQVVKDYRLTDPISKYHKSKDLQSLVETAIEHLESGSRLQAGNIPEQENKDRQNLRQIRRMLVRDAYFLQKERQWLDQERLKLNSHLANANNHKRHRNKNNRTAQVQTSLERHHYQPEAESESKQQQLLYDDIMSQPTHPRVPNHHQPRRSQDSSAFTQNVTETSQVDNLSVVSTFEQDRKKIQLLSANLALEKEYNQELSMQLSAQMELIKIQNEKLLAGESHINEMKLRLLVKYEQIKLLEDFYNRYNAGDEQHQIHLDIELDEQQLKEIVMSLHQKYQIPQQDQPVQQSEKQDDDSLLQTPLGRMHYPEYWAQTGVAAILRHLLMERCRFNPANHRLQYAFLLMKCVTLRPVYDRPLSRLLNGTAQLKDLLQASTMNDSRLEETPQQEFVMDVIPPEEQHVIEYKQHHELARVKEQLQQAQQQLVQVVEIGDMDWFQVYWQKKRGEYFDENSDANEQIRDVAIKLEGDVASFWKFRARNTLRLMQLHSARRSRMLHYFAFQRFKVQAMRATVAKVIAERFEVQNSVQIPNSHSVSPKSTIQQPQSMTAEMTVSKRHALLMLLTLNNDKLNDMRHKNRALAKWKEAVKDSQRISVQLEVGRLAREVEMIRRQEEIVRTSFQTQKIELESKVTVLLGMIAL